MTDRDRLAADLEYALMVTPVRVTAYRQDDAYYKAAADRLIALGWTNPDDDFKAWKQRIRAAERARIRAAVEGLALPRDAADPTYIRGWDEALNAVLRIIDGEDSDDRP